MPQRPIRPEKSEIPRIKKAFRTARFMKWAGTPLAWLLVIVSIAIGAGTHWAIGWTFGILSWATLFIYGYSRARCPRCGQIWYSKMSGLTFAPWYIVAAGAATDEDETESFVCRTCRLDIGPALK